MGSLKRTAYAQRLPVWASLDVLNNYFTRIAFAILYTSIYVVFAPSAWFYHCCRFIFNGTCSWCIHKLVRSQIWLQNFDNRDESKTPLHGIYSSWASASETTITDTPQEQRFCCSLVQFDILYMPIKIMRTQVLRLNQTLRSLINNEMLLGYRFFWVRSFDW